VITAIAQHGEEINRQRKRILNKCHLRRSPSLIVAVDFYNYTSGYLYDIFLIEVKKLSPRSDNGRVKIICGVE
tara:strand:- start:2667 stop:2885 length:219 start_codon:yes stop_codon:yes gene_type:complete